MVVAYDRSILSQSQDSLGALPKDASQAIYFSTTGSDWKNKLAGHGERGENYLEVHSIGQRATKYKAMPHVALCLPNRSHESYQQDYCEKPFADLHDNHEFAKEYKAPPRRLPNLALKKSTQYARDFEGPTQSQLGRARPDRFIPEDPEDDSFRTLGGKGQTLLTASQSQADFGPTSCKLPARSFHHETSIAPLGSSAKSWRTTYSREHTPWPMASKSRRRQKGIAALGGRPGRMSPEAVGVLVEASRQAVRRSFSAPSQQGVLDRPF
mmetsp:Transcript_31611/g.62103  ORF Transcript_31611/g.62103 Transcript_31611/m.62103 type:complete len:268 (+) Transcript_31611:51-854(+)